MNRILAMAAVAAGAFFSFGFAAMGEASASEKENKEITRYTNTAELMGTIVTSTIYGTEDLSETIDKELSKLEEQLISWRKEDSELAKINELAGTGPVSVSSRMMEYLEAADGLSRASGGAFDFSMGTLIRLWDIDGEAPRVPNQSEITNALKEGGWKAVELDAEKKTISIPEGWRLDFGAIGKGIGCDVLYSLFEHCSSVQAAVVSVGGSILTYGEKPDGSAFKIAIRNPDGEAEESMGVLTLESGSVVSTSGDYEKYFEEDGIRYHHLLDPATGFPSDSDLASVTIVNQDGLVNDGLSTACYILGYEDSLALLEEYEADAIFVTHEKDVWVTEGLKDCFVITDDSFSMKEE